MLEFGERQNVLSIQSITNSIVIPYQDSLVQASKLTGPQIRELVQTEILDQLVREKMRDSELVKLRIFDSDNKVIYSTIPAEMGVVIGTDNLGWSAKNLAKPISTLSFVKEFIGLQGQADKRYILSTSVPVLNRTGKGNFIVIELFADVTHGMGAIHTVVTQMIIASVGVLFVVLVIIYLAARRADSVLELEAEVSREAMESSNRLGKILDQSANEIFVFAAEISFEGSTPFTTIPSMPFSYRIIASRVTYGAMAVTLG